MSNVRNYTDKQLLERIMQLPSFTGWPTGPLDCWVASDEDEFDRFDDKCYSFDCFGDKKLPEFRGVYTGTTNAGQFGLIHFEEYNSQGCAVLARDTIVLYSHEYGLHKGKPAYRQVKAFPYYRDNNRNKKSEEIGELHYDIIAANCHRAGANSTVIANWSVACLVKNVEQAFLQWLKWANKRKLSVCILKEFEA